MLECHPILKPFVYAAKPLVHAVRHWRPHHHVVGVMHHAHHAVRHAARAVPKVAPSQTVMIVCRQVAGPLLAGGVALLPPASGIPAGGGIGGFPAGFIPEYGTPAFVGPGYAGYPGGGYGPGGYGGILAPSGILGPAGFISGTSATPILLVSNVPSSSDTPTTTPISAPPHPSFASPPPSTTGPVPPHTTLPPLAPGLPGGPGKTQGGPDQTPVGPGKSPGGSTPVPEPASLALLGAAVGAMVLLRTRRRMSNVQ